MFWLMDGMVIGLHKNGARIEVVLNATTQRGLEAFQLRVHAERAGSAAHRGAEVSSSSGFLRGFECTVELIDKL